MFTPSKVVIEGRTDLDSDDDNNLELSQERTNSMCSFPVDAYKFISPGMVDDHRLWRRAFCNPKRHRRNKAINRRVEIVIWE